MRGKLLIFPLLLFSMERSIVNISLIFYKFLEHTIYIPWLRFVLKWPEVEARITNWKRAKIYVHVACACQTCVERVRVRKVHVLSFCSSSSSNLKINFPISIFEFGKKSVQIQCKSAGTCLRYNRYKKIYAVNTSRVATHFFWPNFLSTPNISFLVPQSNISFSNFLSKPNLLLFDPNF